MATFSPTGGTKKVAEAIVNGTGCRVETCDLTDAEFSGETVKLADCDCLLAAVPVYGGRVPSAATERLKMLNGNGIKAVAVVVYGNREYEDALLEVKNTLEEKGFQVIAAAAFVAEHSIARSIAAGRPDESDMETARSFGADIIKKINDGDVNQTITVPGNMPYKEVKGSNIHPTANDDCAMCGICAKSCPVNAIPLDSPNLTLSNQCMNCMRCLEICPKHARSMPEAFLSGAKAMLEKNASVRKEPEIYI